MNLPFSFRRAAQPARMPTHLEITHPNTADTRAPRPRMSSGGLVAHYVNRRLDTVALESHSSTPAEMPVALPIGRGSPEHESYVIRSTSGAVPTTAAGDPASRRWAPRRNRAATLSQRLIAAGLVVTICATGFASNASAQQRYRVQSGDTLQSVAAEFGVDPEAIYRSSWLSNPPDLTVGDVIVIPDPGQTPEQAALTAAEDVGTSPWTSGVYWVESGDSIESISAIFDVDPEDLLALNGMSWSDIIYPNDRLLIPGSGDAAAAVANTGEAATATGPVLDAHVWVPTHVQEHGLSCEYAAAYIATSAFDNAVPEWVFIDTIPVASNPHYGFRGDIDGTWGQYDDWGIYAEPLVPVLNDYGFAAEAFYSMGDTTQLKAHLDEGHPVVVWLAMWGDTGRVYEDEGRYTVFAGSHVMTAYGYDSHGLYLSDPGTGSYRFIDWGTFVWMWGTIDGMSLAIYPF